jgi:hypothetical protein
MAGRFPVNFVTTIFREFEKEYLTDLSDSMVQFFSGLQESADIFMSFLNKLMYDDSQAFIYDLNEEVKQTVFNLTGSLRENLMSCVRNYLKDHPRN